MTEYFVEKPMPQFGKDIYSCIPIPNEIVAKIRADAIDECIRKLAESEETILTDKQYYTLQVLKEQK